MANHPQALRRHRQSLKRRARNRGYTTQLKTVVKTLRTAIDNNESSETLDKLLVNATSTIDHVASKGVITSATASRRNSRLAIAVNKAKASGPAAAEPKAATAKKAPAKKKTAAKKTASKAKK